MESYGFILTKPQYLALKQLIDPMFKTPVSHQPQAADNRFSIPSTGDIMDDFFLDLNADDSDPLDWGNAPSDEEEYFIDLIKIDDRNWRLEGSGDGLGELWEILEQEIWRGDAGRKGAKHYVKIMRKIEEILFPRSENHFDESFVLDL